VIIRHFRRDQFVTAQMDAADALFLPAVVLGEFHHGAFPGPLAALIDPLHPLRRRLVPEERRGEIRVVDLDRVAKNRPAVALSVGYQDHERAVAT